MFHSDTKFHKKTFKYKIKNMVDIISDYDKEFKILKNNDLDDCVDRVKYFIGNEENLDILDDDGFVCLIDEIQQFYEEKIESLLDYNYKIKLYFDFATNKQKVIILQTEIAEYNESIDHLNLTLRTNDFSPEDDYDDLNDFSFDSDRSCIKSEEQNGSNQILNYSNIFKERNLATNENYDINVEDIYSNKQCKICGESFEEIFGLERHVKYKHKDYFFDEEKSLLLKEALRPKEYSLTKCKLCLENFKLSDLNLHIKRLHPNEFEELQNDTENIMKTNKIETCLKTANNDIFFEERINRDNVSKRNLTDGQYITIQDNNAKLSHDLQNDDQFCDVTLAWEDKKFSTDKIHKGHIVLELDTDNTSICESFEDKDDRNWDYRVYQDYYNKDSSENIEYDDVLLNSMSKTTNNLLSVEWFGTSIQQEFEIAESEIDEELHNSIQKQDSCGNFIKNNPCEICDNLFAKKQNLMQHLLTIHGYKCDECENKFSKQNNHEVQMKTIHENDIYKCEYCNYTSENNNILGKHIFMINKHKRRKRKKQKKDWKKRRKF